MFQKRVQKELENASKQAQCRTDRRNPAADRSRSWPPKPPRTSLQESRDHEADLLHVEGRTSFGLEVALAFFGSEFAGDACAREFKQLSNVQRVHLNRCVITGGGETLAIGAKRHAGDVPRLAAEGQQLLAAFGVPHLRRLVRTSGGQALAIRAKRHTEDRG